MYSPKIQPELIPLLYRKSKQEHVPMTRLVNSILRLHFKSEAEQPERVAETQKEVLTNQTKAS